MRLIDAGTLKAWFFRPYSNEEAYSNTEVGTVIDSQPTIDAKPVVRGHWTNISISVSGHSSAECSVCGCVVHDGFSNVINYCPNCGASMR